ncbi:ABC transporter, membrane spanning protein [Fulvimarina pelagi HTCC2506]|uniref:ABC transporter, membrane spanning protein n=1 Tax=Fulvimarina pelagi HTCC2506 TaxID=314231 RepID=Q0FY85_9HYPH|nr:urea ABC transporter permease subunit UrtC [Fulvimarina pelagi]EAU39857.1 ABC transporter, membrane spanning protein [Fulvimarina pelagi HTCC2506]
MTSTLRNDFLSIAAFAALIVLAVPLFFGFDGYELNTFARYLCLGMVAMALALSWGTAGILNLGQAAPFGLGAYIMAMHLKLMNSTSMPGGMPDFMGWMNIETLPWFWQPFHSLGFTLLAGLLFPAAMAFAIGAFIFKGRVSGVFVAIITLAVLVAIQLLFVEEQGYTGGQNGLTGLALLTIFGVTIDNYSLNFYYLVAASLLIVTVLATMLSRSKAGLVLRAVREDPNRARFLGYDVSNYEILVFSVSAAIAGFAGMLYTLVLQFASPTYMSVSFSLSIVIWCAVGGRESLIGAAIGAIVVNMLEGRLSDVFVEAWLMVLGVLFIAIVLFLPRGLYGLAVSVLDAMRSQDKARHGTTAKTGEPTRPGESASTSPTASLSAGE